MLLTRMRGVVSTSESPLRGLFEPDDAWLATGDLFRADEDGDFWLVDHVAALIRTEHGYVAAFPIIDALGDLDAVDLAVGLRRARPSDAGRVAGGRRGHAARGLRARRRRARRARSPALAAAERPDMVRVVDEIPVTTWYRPNAAALRAAGAPAAAGSGAARATRTSARRKPRPRRRSRIRSPPSFD